MGGQEYRVIADRDKGDDPTYDDVDTTTDHVTVEQYGQPTERIVRTERPVPTEHCLSTAHHAEHEWGDHDNQPGTGYWCRGFDASDELPSLPTREQIAEALWREYRGGPYVEWSPLDEDAKDEWRAGADAVLALIQKGADR